MAKTGLFAGQNQSYGSARLLIKTISPKIWGNEILFYYTYILQSKKLPDRFYVGFTEHLESRLESHNRGENPHTSKYKPWRIKTAIAFSNRQRAIDFEEYLKSPSGRAFSKKRL